MKRYRKSLFSLRQNFIDKFRSNLVNINFTAQGEVVKNLKLSRTTALFIAAVFTLSLVILYTSRSTVSATVPIVNVLQSVDTSGNAGTATDRPDVSKDGRYVVFESTATNLISGDTNGKKDIFVRDNSSGTTTRVSVSSGGTQATNDSTKPSISSDGRYVVFNSEASNLIASDINGSKRDVFLHDMNTGTTEVVSLSIYGSQTGNAVTDYRPDVSRGGRYVVFTSGDSGLVASDTNASQDIFVRDRKLNTTTRLSVSTAGTQGNADSVDPTISCDGAYITFNSGASNLSASDTNGVVDVFLVNRVGGHATYNLTEVGNYTSNESSISCDGSAVTFYSASNNLVAGDTNNFTDVFRYDVASDTTQLASISTGGSQGDSTSWRSSISANGNCIVFESNAQNFDGSTASVYDVYLRNITAGTTELISRRPSQYSTGQSILPTISDDGKYATYSSSDQMVGVDTNYTYDVYRSETGATNCAF